MSKELEIKEQRAIRFLQSIENKDDLYLGFSGGKDSVVILDLAKRSGIKFNPIYACTTMDAPGTVGFIKKNYPEVKIEHPKYSFYDLVERKGLPSRLRRFCCEELKEKYGVGRRTIEGMRSQESSKRSLYEPEQCDTRKSMKGAKHILPILGWTDNDVWGYIKKYNLPYSKYYDAPYNFKRHGCIGCPLATSKSMRFEFKTFPKYAKRLIGSIKKHMENKPNNFIAKNFDNEYEAFYFYINDYSVEEINSLKNGLFNFNAKEIIEKEIINSSQNTKTQV